MDPKQQNNPQLRLPAAPGWHPSKWRFRWRLIVIPAITCGAAVWFLSGIDSHVISWERIMDLLHVKNRERYTRLAMMGAVLCCVLLCLKCMRSNEDK